MSDFSAAPGAPVGDTSIFTSGISDAIISVWSVKTSQKKQEQLVESGKVDSGWVYFIANWRINCRVHFRSSEPGDEKK